jgi:predicted acyl esterase
MRPGPAILSVAACLIGCSDGNAKFEVRASVAQIYVTHAPPGTPLAVYNGAGHAVASGSADALGSLVFRDLTPGSGYTVRATTLHPPQTSRHLIVMSVAGSLPDHNFYATQKLKPGFNYITTRDGTTLSAYITFPGDASQGPFPTVVDYSGYAPSKPGMPVGGFDYLCPSLPVLCDAPNDPSALLAALFGYATVSVNIRGTGCSAGAYDFFETLQLLDGYDVIETVAAQDWVKFHKVGMVGLSYPGIAELFVAEMQPPSLASIAPLSVIGAANTTMLPGGILNNGFATEWISQVIDGAKPYGQGWEQGRVDAGDKQCAENQLLHGQYIDNVKQAMTTKFYDPAQHDRLNPTTFVDKIAVPVFLGGAWQDEQTGPYFFPLLSRFVNAPTVRFSVYNGVHLDGYQPAVLAEWEAFLDLFVAHKIPGLSDLVATLSPQLIQQVFNASLPIPKAKWSTYTDVDKAIADWKAQPPVRAIFESGAGDAMDLGAPKGTFELDWQKWPPPSLSTLRYYLHADGSLQPDMPTEAQAASSFDLDAANGERINLAPGGNVWDKLPDYDWQPPAAGKGLAFETAPFASDTILAGPGSVDLWLQSTVDDADLEVNLIEVRPDGKEMYVQSGWIRASLRGSGPDATELWPAPTFMQKDFAPLVPGQWTTVRVGVAGFHHVFRAGSRLRLFINTPGGSRAAWRFALKTFDGATVTHTIGHDVTHASSVALPLVMGASAPSPLPPCPSLRGQPCRDYAAYANRAAP